MPFDPTLPVDNSAMSAPEMRAQLNSLNDRLVEQELITAGQLQRIDDLEQAVQGLQAQANTFLVQADLDAQTPNNVNAVSELTVTVSNPPTQAETQQVVDKVSELIVALHR